MNADELWLPLDRETALILHSDQRIGEIVIKAPHKYGVNDFNQIVVLNAVDEIYCHLDDVERVTALDLPEPNRPLMQLYSLDWAALRTDGINMPPRRKPLGSDGRVTCLRMRGAD